MKKEDKYGIPVVVLLALVITVASDYCDSSPLHNKVVSISSPSFDPICYVASYKPEAPEIQSRNPIPQYSNIFAINASGTAIGSPSTSASPSPSPEIPDEA